MMLAEIGPHDYVDPDVPELVLSFPLEIVKPGQVLWNVGDGWNKRAWTPGSFFALPPNTASAWKAECTRRLLLMVVPTSTLKRVFGTSTPASFGDAFLPLSTDTFEDPFLQSLMLKLWQVSKASLRTDYLLADGLLTTMLSMLLQRAGTAEFNQKIALSPSRLKRVFEFVEAEIEESINVVDMARVAGLSSRHFGRAFALEIGETPHHWLMQKRIDRAKLLLLNSDFDCMTIAAKCGFASQSHLTVAMKNQVGVTPTRWRQFNRQN
ncbi:helix-turn-helix domain-containing protein [Mesorhizobium sp. AaZ16]|uniref:helix-turn-helix domain-containing protein n=1 Tax=Mesorhizobium sp. AaZ16 TaxID=3402289 RepID=UPI00374E3FF1